MELTMSSEPAAAAVVVGLLSSKPNPAAQRKLVNCKLISSTNNNNTRRQPKFVQLKAEQLDGDDEFGRIGFASSASRPATVAAGHNGVATAIILDTNSHSSGKLSSSSGSFGSVCSQIDMELGNKCGKCQNHEVEVSKKGHARECPFKKCDCLKCRLLDARSDILQVISGKETKLKGTKKDPNCGFCQNHGVKILRKGHVRSCGFGQERHFTLDNCFDCEVHYIRNEVNRLQIKMRRAMKEDRTLSEEQRKTAREAITRDEVEKVCDMARVARRKRENILSRQVNTSNQEATSAISTHSQIIQQQQQQLNHRLIDAVWRPWSQHQAAIVAQQQQQQQLQPLEQQAHQQQAPLDYDSLQTAGVNIVNCLNDNDNLEAFVARHEDNNSNNQTRSPSPAFGPQLVTMAGERRQLKQELLSTTNHANHQFSPMIGHHHHQQNQHVDPFEMVVASPRAATTPNAVVATIAQRTSITAQEQQLFNILQFFQTVVAHAAQSNARSTIE